jgi:hypothetical protein
MDKIIEWPKEEGQLLIGYIAFFTRTYIYSDHIIISLKIEDLFARWIKTKK